MREWCEELFGAPYYAVHRAHLHDAFHDALRAPGGSEALIRMWLGPGGHFVCYPVSGGEQISFAATAPLRDRSAESWTAAGDPAELARVFGGWKGLVSDLVRAAGAGAAAGPVRRWALHDREPLTTWSTNWLTVLRDAAHPRLPFMAQGANQAVEDAMDLAASGRSRPWRAPRPAGPLRGAARAPNGHHPAGLTGQCEVPAPRGRPGAAAARHRDVPRLRSPRPLWLFGYEPAVTR